MKYLHSKNRAILREMISTDFKIRYQGSALGYLWSLLKPLFLFAILYILFTYIVPIGQGVEHYGVILLIGIVLWNFFTETTMVGASSVVAHGDLIRKVSIPRYLILISSSISALINLGLSMIVVISFTLINGIMPSISWLWLIPITIELFIFSLGVAFILATAYVKFRDITYIWEVVLQAGFYASVIIFPIAMVPESVRDFFFINPIVQIVQDARNAILPGGEAITLWSSVDSFLIMVAPFIIVGLSALIGTLYFKSQSKFFAEDI